MSTFASNMRFLASEGLSLWALVLGVPLAILVGVVVEDQLLYRRWKLRPGTRVSVFAEVSWAVPGRDPCAFSGIVRGIVTSVRPSFVEWKLLDPGRAFTERERLTLRPPLLFRRDEGTIWVRGADAAAQDALRSVRALLT